MGPEGGDELNVIEAGSNYGWPEASDGSDYGGGEIPDHAEGDGYAAPARSWNPSISPGSLMVYDGELFEAWRGDAFLGALSGEALVRVDLDGRTAGETEVFDMGAARPRGRGRPRRRDLGARGRGRRPPPPPHPVDVAAGSCHGSHLRPSKRDRMI